MIFLEKKMRTLLFREKLANYSYFGGKIGSPGAATPTKKRKSFRRARRLDGPKKQVRHEEVPGVCAVRIQMTRLPEAHHK